MARKIPDKVYRQRAKKLAAVGYDTKAGKRITTKQKRKIQRIWKQKKFYITNAKRNRFDFVRVRSRSSIRTARSALTKAQITPKGFFVQRPKGIKRGSLKYSLRNGTLEVTAKGRMHDVIIPLKYREVVKSPVAARDAALKGRKKPRQVKLMVNGAQGKTNYPLENFFDYLNERLPEIKQISRLTNKQMEDIFHLRLVY